MLWPSGETMGPISSGCDHAAALRRVSRNRLRASAGFELFLGVQRQLDHALEQLIGR